MTPFCGRVIRESYGMYVVAFPDGEWTVGSKGLREATQAETAVAAAEATAAMSMTA